MTVYFLMLVALIAAAWFVIRKINAEKRHPVLTANLICGAAFGSVVLLFCMEQANLDHARLLYDCVYNRTILSDSFRYQGIVDGYHIVSGTLIPEEQATVSFISKLYRPVNLYCMGGKEWKDAVKIVPDFFPLQIGAALLDIAACILMNLAVLTRKFYRLFKLIMDI